LADAGAAGVALADVDVVGGEEAAAGVEKAGAKALFVSTDVSNPDDIVKLFETAEREFGGIDIVHNNAGTMAGNPAWPETPLSKIQLVTSVNLLGVLYGVRVGIDALAKRGGGAIVNTASVAAFGPMPMDPMYSSSKIAIVHVTQACASLRQSHNIRVNAVLPGIVLTNILNVTGDGTKPADWLAPVLEFMPMLEPEHIAAGVLELIRDDDLAGANLVIANPPAKGAEPVRVLLRDPMEVTRYMAQQAGILPPAG
jgi:3-oxoacyl-[acyl-carrier protein] reductase